MMRFIVAYLVYTWGVLHRYYAIKNGVTTDFVAAVRYFSRALAIDPTLRLARLHRGRLLWRELGQPAAAIADLDVLLTIDPDDAEARFDRAMALQANGRFAAALADLDHYLTLPPNEEYWDTAVRSAALLREVLAE